MPILGSQRADGAGGQAAAKEVRRALTEGDMARPPESGWARRVMRDAGARTWDQYLDKVRKGEIWGGACEVGRWAQSKGCRIAMYQEWGPRGHIERWQRWVKESEQRRRYCGADKEGDTMSCCRPRKKRKQRQWRGRKRRTGQSRNTRKKR